MSRNPGKFRTVVPTVERNADGMVFARNILENVVCKPLSGHSHSVFVHPVGAHTHLTAKSAGTEFQFPVESVLKSGHVAGVNQLMNSLFRSLVIIPENPGFRIFHVVHKSQY